MVDILILTLFRYFCGSARKFLSVNGVHLDFMSLTCNWNKSWSPAPEIHQCDWVACLEPPHPPAYANLRVTDWFGDPIDFGEKVKFVCERGMMFEDDPDIEFVEYQCKNGTLPGIERGYFKIPEADKWPRCTSGYSIKMLAMKNVLFY